MLKWLKLKYITLDIVEEFTVWAIECYWNELAVCGKLRRMDSRFYKNTLLLLLIKTPRWLVFCLHIQIILELWISHEVIGSEIITVEDVQELIIKASGCAWGSQLMVEVFFFVTRSLIVDVKLPNLRILWRKSIVALCTTKAENCCWYKILNCWWKFVKLFCRHHDWYWYDPVISSFPYCYDWTKPPSRSEVKYLMIDLESKWFAPVWLGLCWLF